MYRLHDVASRPSVAQAMAAEAFHTPDGVSSGTRPGLAPQPPPLLSRRRVCYKWTARWEAVMTASNPDLGVLDTRFRTALRRLDEAGCLLKVHSPVDPHLEIAGLVKQRDGDVGFLFENVKG